MKTRTSESAAGRVRARRQMIVEIAAFSVCAALTAWSAVRAKETGSVSRPLVAVESASPIKLAADRARPVIEPLPANDGFADDDAIKVVPVVPADGVDAPEGRRWFDARPVKPVRTIWMTVTGYSPDARSCGKFADGKTATLHSVYTNAMQLVAADRRVLPEGSIISVPGYASAEIVPVLDVGGAIKGNKLDVLFATHAEARRWGVRRIPVTVWAYDDGLPPTNPRKAR